MGSNRYERKTDYSDRSKVRFRLFHLDDPRLQEVTLIDTGYGTCLAV